MTAISLKTVSILLLSACLTLLLACKTAKVEKPLRIALSSGSDNYVNWIHRGDSLVEVVDLHAMQIDSAIKLLASCDAILFTGGEDVVPAYYGKVSDSARCETNPARDSLEFALIKESFRLKIPIFGVCRGQQILNVALGGTLIIDIPTDHPGNVAHRCEDYLKCFHSISAVAPSQLKNVAKADTGMVTTNHHQAVEKPAAGLRVAAWSSDSIAEAIEWETPSEKPFLMAVQWHPERMDTLSPFSMPLMKAFLKAASAYQEQKELAK
jgi:putative glutamine amidotransferase